MSGYDIVKFFHVFAAIAWVGAGIMVQLLGAKATRATDINERARIAKSAAWLGTHYFIPISLATVVLGVLTVVAGPWSFGDTWIILGLAGYAVTFITGATFLGPQSEKISAMIDERGPADGEVKRLIDRVLVVGRVDAFVLVAITFDMVVKPGA